MQYNCLATAIAALGMTSLVAGCGGSSGGGSSDFASLSQAISPNNTTTIAGTARTTSYNANASTGDVTSISPVKEEAASLRLAFDQNSMLERARVSGTQANVVFDADAGDLFVDEEEVITAVSADGQDLAAFADPETLGFNYQTFGAWLTGYNTGSGTAGAGSFGAATDLADVPVSGTASYAGAAGGLYVAPDGTAYAVAAEMNATANFGTGQVAFATSSSTGADLSDGAVNNLPGLDLAGTLVVGSGSGFSGAVSSADSMTGDADGRFYGPNAEELGGTFAVSDANSAYAGAFGGAQ